MRISISEIFESIQWEGRNVWKPSIFIRFWWCNLQCRWCDSKYSWDANIEQWKILKLKDVIEKIKRFKSKHIVFTWWEPTLFQEHMLAIQEQLWKWYTYELETNGTRKLLYDIKFSQINVSPKLTNSWNKRYKLEIFDSLWSAKVDLKFVSDGSDLQEIEQVIEEITKKYKINRIYIMPLWSTIESQKNEKILKFCIENSYNYCLRQHIVLFWWKRWT